MRVLIIGHNVISETNNMGKTLLSYFRDFQPDEVAEFYIQDKDPKNANVVNSFYRITDREALKSIMGLEVGKSFYLEHSETEANNNNTGAVESIRQYGRRRNALVYIVRNALWDMAHWKTPKLIKWIQNFNPDVIFFMAGDYRFMYKITLFIQNLLNKPLVVCCVDDYFLYNRNGDSVLGRHQHKSYMKMVRKVMDKAFCILTISDTMGKEYQKLFNKPCFTLHTSAKKRHLDNSKHSNSIAYFGNLGFHRFEQLVEIGKAVKQVEGFGGIDVYSGEKNPKNLVGLTEENGIYFRGEITAKEVCERMDKCMAIIHTESFDKKIQNQIKYSVSTKIADSLLNGPCLIAYGPEGIASIDYLKKFNAAYIISRKEDLEWGLREILTNEQLRTEIVRNARKLGAQNHDINVVSKMVRKCLQLAVDSK